MYGGCPYGGCGVPLSYSFRVLDEVDQMLDMGFVADVELILKRVRVYVRV
jgi:superfamily II DNA/RNA helicase